MNAGESDEMNAASPGPAAENVDPATKQALDRIRTALSRKQGEEATRFFKEAMAHGLIPNDDHVLTWLRESAGKELAERLINAFAIQPCFYCKQGLMACEDCKGRGHDSDHTLCAECLALGIDRCDFCGGSGWLEINLVPPPFQLSVITRRVLMAAKEAEVVLTRALPIAEGSEPVEFRKLVGKNLLQANRLLAVLENMIVAARRQESSRPDSAGLAHKAIAACEAVAPRLSELARQLLGVLAEAATAEARSAIRTAARRLAERRAEFYNHLAESGNFSGTLLRHPLLIEANVEVKTTERADAAKNDNAVEPENASEL